MWQDVVDLRDFYESEIGKVSSRLLREKINAFWPDLSGHRLLGLGYATPYLVPYQDKAERTLAVMPSGQGVLPWPMEGPGSVTLADETELPFSDNSIDRVLLVHAIESSEQASAMLDEIWRVLSGGGRLLILAPNRRGFWSHSERTPFGFGQPFTQRQLAQLLRRQGFTPLRSEGALFFLPFARPAWLKAAPSFEKIGRRWFGAFSGVILIEAMKQLYNVKPLLAKRSTTSFALTLPRPAPTSFGIHRQSMVRKEENALFA